MDRPAPIPVNAASRGGGFGGAKKVSNLCGFVYSSKSSQGKILRHIHSSALTAVLRQAGVSSVRLVERDLVDSGNDAKERKRKKPNCIDYFNSACYSKFTSGKRI